MRGVQERPVKRSPLSLSLLTVMICPMNNLSSSLPFMPDDEGSNVTDVSAETAASVAEEANSPSADTLSIVMAASMYFALIGLYITVKRYLYTRDESTRDCELPDYPMNATGGHTGAAAEDLLLSLDEDFLSPAQRRLAGYPPSYEESQLPLCGFYEEADMEVVTPEPDVESSL
eukprot:Blabericola_migrator_1__7454@NODE_3801_length_1499_cov_35_565642_g2356_i0_p1_GENE_NODE_3801_length_1499_cov_35_565642_g2356_i0NODE_3801_length_1499_cov_35_565642_g2356_i0_p1_ORF_typecomplete_len174_score20_44AA_permease_2/PF13520_6/0_048_NODE_3801_length_1499_cov_35_565642_g2356_i0302823